MGDSELLPAPTLDRPRPRDKWAQEFRAFNAMLPELLRQYPGRYVAVHEGGVVEQGDSLIDVAIAAQAKVGNVPIHVGLVTDQPPPLVRISSPRLVRGFTGGSPQ